MAGSMQQTTIFGNVGKDPETKQVGGNQVFGFTVAVNKDRKLPDGTWKKRTYWWMVDCWGERLPAGIRKGAQVLVNGDFEMAWDKDDMIIIGKMQEDQQGRKFLTKDSMPMLKLRSSANRICVARTASAGGEGYGSSSEEPGEEAPTPSITSNALDEDELPF